MQFYPLAANNEWQYKQKDGSVYTNKVTGAGESGYTLHNSATNTSSKVRVTAGALETDALEAGNFQTWIAGELQPGTSWEVNFKANGLDCLLVMTVKETGGTREVEGTQYTNVLCIEGENKIRMNGNLLPLNFFTQYYYAEGVGLVLTTSSTGDTHALIKHSLH